jgi:hypothetical protein
MIVIDAGTNALLRHQQVWGESWSVAGIPACELVNDFKMRKPSLQYGFPLPAGRPLVPLRHEAA